MTSTEFAIIPEEFDVATSVQRQGEYIVLSLELPNGEEKTRRIPFRRYFTNQ